MGFSCLSGRAAFSVLVGLGSLCAVPSSLTAQGSRASPLAIESVTVEPSAPGADTLCRLRLAIKNSGSQPAYALAFDVKIGGQALPVYAHQVFLDVLPPGKTTEVRLFNFWTTETSRPRPADGKLQLEIALREAQWLEISFEGEGKARSEVWTPKGAVSGLPVRAAKTVTLRK